MKIKTYLITRLRREDIATAVSLLCKTTQAEPVGITPSGGYVVRVDRLLTRVEQTTLGALPYR